MSSLITPLWPTQSLFPAILRQAIDTSQIFSSRYLQLPEATKTCPLASKLQLVAFPLSNNAYKIKDYHKQQKTFSSPPEAIQQKMVEFVVRENCYALIPNRWWKDKFSEIIFSLVNATHNNGNTSTLCKLLTHSRPESVQRQVTFKNYPQTYETVSSYINNWRY